MSKAPKLRFKEFSEDWEQKKFKDIYNVKSGYGFKLNEYSSTGIPLIKIDNIGYGRIKWDNISYLPEEYKDSYSDIVLEKDDILLALNRPITNNKLKIAMLKETDIPAILYQRVGKIIVDKTCNKLFSYYLLNNVVFDFVLRESKGSDQPFISTEELKKVKFNIPLIEEQEKIASFFSLIDNKISLQSEKVEALKGYKKGMIQKIFSRELRFKDDEGRDYPEWKHKKLNSIVERVTRKNKGTICTLPLTISAQYGLVDQVIFFNKTVASANLEGYYLLEKGEFAYNKSYSTGYPFGAIKRLDRYDRGVLSSLYICFSILDGVDSDFLVQYFETSCWHKEISMIAVEGARNHGLLNISVSDFFETYHWIPCYDEQVKIGEFLGKIDEKINKEQEKLDSLNEYKKGLLQKMFV